MNVAHSPRIFLHVGALKTASTYLQWRMRANIATLRKHGLYVPVLPIAAEMAGNAKLLTTALNGRATPMFQRHYPQIDVKALDPAKILAQLLEQWRADEESVVLSDENLHIEHAQRLRELLPKSVACVVILLVRRQDRWVDSYFNQLVKTNQNDGNIAAFVTRICGADGGGLFQPDWYAHYEGWRKAFGRCTVVFYDDVSSDVFAAFLSTAGLDGVPNLIDIDRVQVSLDVYQLAYLLALRTPVSFPDFLHRLAACKKTSTHFGRQKTQSLLTTTDLTRLRERFEPSNRRLMAALGRDGEVSPLQLDSRCDAGSYCNLDKLYASVAYGRYRRRADAIYARRKLREFVRSVSKHWFFRGS